MFTSSLTRRLGTGMACLLLFMGTTGCASMVGSALQIAASEASRGRTPGPGLGPSGFPTAQSVMGGGRTSQAHGGQASVYQRGPTLFWDSAGRINRGSSMLPIRSMGPTESLSCGGVPFGLARAIVSPGELSPGPLRGMAPIQRAHSMTSSIQSPYYQPAGFSVLGDGLVTASVAATDPRCGHSVFAFIQFDLIPWGRTSSPAYQFR